MAMIVSLRRHFFSHVPGYLALFVALGGTSYAAVRLPARSVGTRQLQPGAVTNAKIAKGRLTIDRFAAGETLKGLRIRVRTAPVANSTSGPSSNSAQCVGDERAISGGYSYPADVPPATYAQTFTLVDAPALDSEGRATGWTVAVQQADGGGVKVAPTIYVVCVR